MSRYVPVCPGMSRYVPVCPGMSRYVPVCPGMSRYVPARGYGQGGRDAPALTVSATAPPHSPKRDERDALHRARRASGTPSQQGWAARLHAAHPCLCCTRTPHRSSGSGGFAAAPAAPPHPRDRRARAMPRQQRRQHNTSAVGLHERLAIDPLSAPILALNQHVRPYLADYPLGSRVVEHHHVIDHLECREHPRAIDRVIQRPIRTLYLADAAIAVESHDQHFTLRTREAQNLQMARVEKIEAAVGENDTPARMAVAFERGFQFPLGEDLALVAVMDRL